MSNSLLIGAAYYPELWPDDAIEVDISHMREIGIDFAGAERG
jgi:beta-galactosidase GanA